MKDEDMKSTLKKLYIIGMIFILLSIILFTKPMEYHNKIPLLAVTSINETAIRGTIADITIDIVPGNGKVFVNTFPISKLDTVVSTRLAKEYACEYLKKDCSHYNFFYEISSSSQVIGGPSAGLAMTVGTIAAFKGIDIGNIAMTGTINSGGTVGTVGGVKEKIDAAKEDGIKTVLVPEFTTIRYKNTTISPERYGEEIGIKVIPVMTLDDALEVIGIHKEKRTFTTSQDYKEKMKTISKKLCEEAYDYLDDKEELKTIYKELNETINKTQKNMTNTTDYISLTFKKEGVDKLIKAESNNKLERYYAAASFCFGASIDLGYSQILQKNISNTTQIISELNNTISAFNDTINSKDISTIYDLQTMMIVRERIGEASDYINKTKRFNDTEDKLYFYIYAKQRLETARLWSTFFTSKGDRIVLDKEQLRDSCETKIMEVQTRYQYIKEFFPFALGNNLEEAYKYQSNGDYALCLFSASKAKAEGDVLLSLMGVNETESEILLDKKLEIIENKIGEQKDFPLLAYSYYEYAKALKDIDISSSLLYAEYSLELSDLSIYFPKKTTIFINLNILRILILGIGLGFIMSSSVYQTQSRQQEKKRAR